MTATGDLAPILVGYRLIEELYSGSRTRVYRAIREVDEQPVAIKLLHRDYPSFSELLQFRNQYTIAKNLPLPGIVAPYTLESSRNSYALIMEDFGGVSLQQYLQDQHTIGNAKHPLRLTEVLEIALQLADILDGLYRHRVIHKDIKPANILIHPKTKQIKLIDFSISSLLPRETQEIKNPNILEGTLAYISPEQTGRMNRGIDYRTDFYSLGVTLYELLTGQLPFQCHDPMELIHCHLVKQPDFSKIQNLNFKEEPSVSPIISIVMKLMAKNAEDRYQSALGLKYDLEQCLQQWRKNGKIENFQLGQHDICDRFLIREKLYGREAEVQTLLSAFERVANGTSELMLVAGSSGIGKTAIVNEIHKPIVRQRGYFIKGKFDQFNRNIPFSAFVQALGDLMGQILSEDDAQFQKCKTKILEALGDNGQVIIEVIPELEQIIGPQPPTPELSGTAAQNCFNLLFQKFISVFTTKEHPLAIFLDDLQWADSASLKLIQLLMSQPQHGYLLLIGAYRNNEVSSGHPLLLALDEVCKGGANLNRITLNPLTLNSLNDLVADTLSCPLHLAKPLTELVYQKTKGNPFFATQFLKVLYQDKLITFNNEAGHWQCDLTQVRKAALTDNVVEFMAQQLQKLPAETQRVLKLAACIGNQFDLATLVIISQESEIETATSLWKALQEGLIMPQSEVYKFYVGLEPLIFPKTSDFVAYRFLHDRVQQAAYSLIPEEQKEITHLTIGRLLLHNQSEAEHLFEIVNHLNKSISLITDTWERQMLMRLNLMGCHRAKASTAYTAAIRYAMQAIDLLPPEPWQTDYEFALKLYESAAEVAYLNTEFEKAEEIIQLVWAQSDHPIDCLKSYELLVQIYIAKNRQLKAIETGLEALTKLGIPLVDPAKLQENLPPVPDENTLLTRESMSDRAYLAALQILIQITPPVHHVKPELYPAITLTMIELCERAGYSGLAAYAYGNYGVFLGLGLQDLENAHRFGRGSLALLERYQARELQAKVNMLFAVFVCAGKEPGDSTLPLLKQGIQAGLETGDIEHLSYCIMAYFSHFFLLGQPLEEIEKIQQDYLPLLEQFKQEHCIEYSQIWLQLIGKLMSSVVSSDTQLREIEMLVRFEATHNHQCLFAFHLAKLLYYYTFGNYQLAINHAEQASNSEGAAFGILLTAAFNFYSSLTLLASVNPNDNEVQRQKVFNQVALNQVKLKQFSESAPSNYLHKFDLVAAELSRCLGERTEAIDYYDRAIAGAKKNKYLHEEALANELAAQFYQDWGKEKIAQVYMTEAYYCYARWGAKSKVHDLEQRYPKLLASILQNYQFQLTPTQIIHTISSITSSSIKSSTSASSSSSSISATLDLVTVLKAYQALSSEIQLERLVSTLLSMVMENSGADKGVLLLLQENDLIVKAITANSQSSIVQPSIVLEEYQELPISVINSVKRTLQPVVLGNPTLYPSLMADPYTLNYHPKSLLCTPILHQGKLLGILYLENNVAHEVFTSDRVELLNLLCTQAAISLENAQLYQQAQDTLAHLKQMQLQLVQSEKMSALGNLVAGVAHEINNPLSFIAGNIEPAQDYILDLLNLIDLYQQESANPSAVLQEAIDNLDLDYLRQDLPKLVDSMKLGVERIRSISTSLRTFSRADQNHQILFNIHEGIDSTILILKHRLKANNDRPAIEVVKEYGNLPLVPCFPGPLNQVFMNILANAIDALEEANQGRSFKEIQANPNRITIQTRIKDNQWAVIKIIDNGIGMSEDVKSHIFAHLFTTKTVGRGTGLGLAIAHQIVVEKHGGTIQVNSTPGQGTEFKIEIAVSDPLKPAT
ncbi:MAG: AAA family ATPase [Actinomycetota bacterium]